MRQRKLLALHVLQDIERLMGLGVPLAKIVRDKQLDMSAMSVSKLIQYNNLIKHSESAEVTKVVYYSLKAPWVDETLVNVQEQPATWLYTGEFPYGKWERV